MNKKISFASLFFLIFASVANLKTIPAIAIFGPSLIGYFLLSACVFLLPTALTSAFLAANFPDLRGVYDWVKVAYGAKAAFFAVWFQWANTLIWYPSMLIFIAINLLQSFAPDYVNNKHCIWAIILSIFWAITFFNLKGLNVSARLVTIFTCIGTFIPLLVLIGYGIYVGFCGDFVEISSKDLLPSINNFEGFSALIAIFASMLGIEITASHINDVDNSQKNFPRALVLGSISVVFVMIAASLCVATILSKNEISLTSGIFQVFSHIYNAINCPILLPITGVLIAISSIGTMINWLLAPVKGFCFAADDAIIPKFLAHLNSKDTPALLLLIQACLISLVVTSTLYFTSIESFFWIMTALSTEIYLIVYLMIFLSGLRLNFLIQKQRSPVAFLSHKTLQFISCVGFLGCIFVLSISIFPLSLFEGMSYQNYVMSMILGNVIILAIPFFLMRLSKDKAISS